MNQHLRSTFLVTFCLFCLTAFAQLPPNQPEQDCINALSICQDVYFQPNSYAGEGEDPDEINGSTSCLLLGERNSVWYVFTTQTTGQLCFTISPEDTLDDYDWALYNLTNASCSQIATNPSLEVACSWTYNNGCQGQTGPNGNMVNCPGQSQPCINVVAGQTYVLNISNFTASNSGYTVDFSQSTARLYDDIPPQLDEVESFCTGVRVTFNENILCSSVDAADFAFSGPDGPYTISRVLSENCDDGGSFDRTFDLIISPPIQQAGNYTISLVGYIADNCGNGAELKSEPIWMPLPPTAEINSPVPQCELENEFTFVYTGPSDVVDYFWDFGDSIGSTDPAPLHSYTTPGIKTVSLIIQDINGCADTATNQVEVLPKPHARFVSLLKVCQGDTIEFQNETTFPGSSLRSWYWWFSDTTTSTDESPVKTFPDYAKYRAYLEVYNDLGCRDTFAQEITVYPRPEVDFAVEENVCWGDTANLLFKATIGRLDNDSIEYWSWNFGDSSGVSGMLTPAYLYDSPGTYPITLTVVSDKGCGNSLTKEQIIHHPPPPEIINDTVCFGESAFIQALPVHAGITRWFYEPDDEIPFDTLPFQDTEPVTFPYDLYVEQISPEGCYSERIVVEVRHFEVGEGNIVISDSSVEFPDPVIDFSLAGTIKADQYEWNFGDEQIATDFAPSHWYGYPHIFDVVLNVIDIYGCEYELSTKVEVKNPVAIHVPTAFTPNGDGNNDLLMVGHHLLQSFEFHLFNRTGVRVFTTADPNFRWNGYSEAGKALAEGVYVYRLRGIDLMGNHINEQGTVTLIR
ncbi:MAG: PKD domain-containing protein [Bacteroidetes bacterium]|nr:PKD domain-containing protein [Bacteroidota bacterium]